MCNYTAAPGKSSISAHKVHVTTVLQHSTLVNICMRLLNATTESKKKSPG